MSCPSPLSWETLVDWWAGDLDEAAGSSVEEHLLGCEVCSAVANRVAATAEALRTMVPPVVGPDRLASMFRAGIRILENPIAPGQISDFHFPRSADLAVHVLGGLSVPSGSRVEVRSGSSSPSRRDRSRRGRALRPQARCCLPGMPAGLRPARPRPRRGGAGGQGPARDPVHDPAPLLSRDAGAPLRASSASPWCAG